MMVLERRSGSVSHRAIGMLPELLRFNDLLLLNDTRVIPARLFANRPTGRRFEMLLLGEEGEQGWEALLRPSAKARAGERLVLSDGGAVVPVERRGEGRWLVRFDPPLDLAGSTGSARCLTALHRAPGWGGARGRCRYQTVYAVNPGAVAAPTAGLHFTDALLGEVRAKGVELAFLTLHVGLGTFRPVKPSRRLPTTRCTRSGFTFTEKTAEAVNRALDDGRRIVCVGTTSVRALEGALEQGDGRVVPGQGPTRIFITPGFAFRGTGAMLTNFHLPRSTLLMMISAFAGRELVFGAYEKAVAESYRFFSYGDAMFIE